MKLVIEFFGLILILAMLSCSSNHKNGVADGDAALPRTAKKTANIDPMLFVVTHQVQIEKIIRDHKDDCGATQASLLRFIAHNKESFLEKMAKQPEKTDNQANSSEHAIQFLMKFTESCPTQAERFNQAILAIVR